MTHAYLSCVTLSLKMRDSPSNKFAKSLSSRAGRSPGSEPAHMSVLGQKQTYALQNAMSASPAGVDISDTNGMRATTDVLSTQEPLHRNDSVTMHDE